MDKNLSANSQLRNKPIDYARMCQIAGKTPFELRAEFNNQRLSCTDSQNLSTMTTTITFTSATCSTVYTTATAAINSAIPSGRMDSQAAGFPPDSVKLTGAATKLAAAQKMLKTKRKIPLSPNNNNKRANRVEVSHSASTNMAKSSNSFALLDMDMDATSEGEDDVNPTASIVDHSNTADAIDTVNSHQNKEPSNNQQTLGSSKPPQIVSRSTKE
ncbi:uncharacterized protein LOC122757654 [Drosophila mojavensis]|uniref:uncharacterized protein LOC122757654 n=1 Tax=Drosophila mojavensis TaxID=7230 RepID=UPI001CD10136|nr:uncharacterized protein LOC122757654 [Drosophila mojavensis]